MKIERITACLLRTFKTLLNTVEEEVQKLRDEAGKSNKPHPKGVESAKRDKIEITSQKR
ncbi:hypothetical protein WDW37_11285 [Bdellovibrionota bacterium FG-1]